MLNTARDSAATPQDVREILDRAIVRCFPSLLPLLPSLCSLLPTLLFTFSLPPSLPPSLLSFPPSFSSSLLLPSLLPHSMYFTSPVGVSLHLWAVLHSFFGKTLRWDCCRTVTGMYSMSDWTADILFGWRRKNHGPCMLRINPLPTYPLHYCNLMCALILHCRVVRDIPNPVLSSASWEVSEIKPNHYLPILILFLLTPFFSVSHPHVHLPSTAPVIPPPPEVSGNTLPPQHSTGAREMSGKEAVSWALLLLSPSIFFP